MRKERLEEEEIIRKILQAPEIFWKLGDERDEVFERVLKYFKDKKERSRRFKTNSKLPLTQAARNIQEEIISDEAKPDMAEWRAFHKMLTLMVVNATEEDLSTLSKKWRDKAFEMILQYFWQEYSFWGI